jgi:hypothetical protein
MIEILVKIDREQIFPQLNQTKSLMPKKIKKILK